MTLDQLRVFVAVAERQHVTRAADALNLAQSAASAAIAALEARYGIRLFDRIGRGIALTPAGIQFLGEARAVLAQAGMAERALAELAGLRRGTLAVHASQTIASYWLPRHLVAYRAAYPGISIRLAVGNTAQVARAVRDGSAELGFVEGTIADPALAGSIVATDQMVLVVAPDHPWAGRREIVPADLLCLEWVLREPGSGTRSEFEAAMTGFGLATESLRVVLELPSNESVRAAVEAGLGATALSGSVAAPSLDAGLLAQLAMRLPARSFHSLHHKSRALSNAAAALLQIIGTAPR